MARNVQTIEADLPEPQGEQLEPETPPARKIYDMQGKKTITPLRKMLSEVPMEVALNALHTLNVSLNLRSIGKGFWNADLKGHGTFSYHASGSSPRMALANVLALFFANEQKDIHDYPNFDREKDEL